MTNVIRKLNNINFICFDFLSLILCIFSLPLTTTIYYRNRTFRPGISKLRRKKTYLMIVEWNLNLSQAGLFHLVYFSEKISETSHTEERWMQYCSIEIITKEIEVSTRCFYDFCWYSGEFISSSSHADHCLSSKYLNLKFRNELSRRKTVRDFATD